MMDLKYITCNWGKQDDWLNDVYDASDSLV